MTVQRGAGDRTDAGLRRAWNRPARSGRRRLVELLVLTGFVVAQPVLDVYGRSSDVFVFRDISGRGVVAFTAVVVLAPPLLLWLLGTVAAGLDARLGTWVHEVTMLVLWSALWVEVLDSLGAPAAVAAPIGVLLGIASAVLFSLRPALRMWVSFASPAPLVFALVFLTMTPVSGLVLPHGGTVAGDARVGRPAPVVMLVLDEFPLASLLGPDGQIDADLYPHVAALAAGSNTYLNVTSNSGRTPYSVPSILTGEMPDGHDVPTAATHPDSLFTLLGRSHDLRVHELLNMCPGSLCGQQAGHGAWDGFGSLLSDGFATFTDILDPRGQRLAPGVARGEAVAAMRRRSGEAAARDGGSGVLLTDRYADFLDDLDRPAAPGRPPFAFFHILLPHAPWLLTPSGQRYDAPRGLPGALDMDGEIAWEPAGTFVGLARQRHLLQVQYVDRMVGELMARMQASGTWDRSLVVLTADHGTAFIPGQPRRAAGGPNVPEIAWVPLFVKLPGQRSGTPSMANAQLVDVAPTVADVLDVTLPWTADGRSLLGRPRPPEHRRPFLAEANKLLSLDGVRLRPAVQEHSVGTFAPRVGDPLRIFRTGPGGLLVGRRVAGLEPGGPVAGRARVTRPHRWQSVDTGAGTVPMYLTGSVHGAPDALRRVAVVVNGVVAGVSRLTAGPGDRDFAVLVPLPLLRDGRNALGVFAVDDADRVSPLPLG